MSIEKTILHLARCENGPTDTKLKGWDVSWHSFIRSFIQPTVDRKDAGYFVRTSFNGVGKRREKNLSDKSQLIIIDADSQYLPDNTVVKGAPPFKKTKLALIELGYPHLIYTTFSHTETVARYRIFVLLPRMTTKSENAQARLWLRDKLNDYGIRIAAVSEEDRWPQPWYMAHISDKKSPFLQSYVEVGKPFPLEQALQEVPTSNVELPCLGGDDTGAGAVPGWLTRYNTESAFFHYLEAADYKYHNKSVNSDGTVIYRFLAPDSDSGTPGVIVYNDSGVWRVVSYHGEHDVLASYEKNKLNGDAHLRGIDLWHMVARLNAKEDGWVWDDENMDQVNEWLSATERRLRRKNHRVVVNAMVTDQWFLEEYKNAVIEWELDESKLAKNILAKTDKWTEDDLVDVDGDVFEFETFANISGTIQPTEWLVQDLIEKIPIGIIFGASGARKTFIAMYLGLCIAGFKNEMVGHKIAHHSVLYCINEAAAAFKKRIYWFQKYYGIQNTSLPFGIVREPFLLENENTVKKLTRTARQLSRDFDKPVGAVFIDTMSMVTAGDLDKNVDAGVLIAKAKEISAALNNCAVIFVHHPGHGDQERERGAYTIRANADQRFKVKSGNNGDSIMTVEKQRNAEGSLELEFKFAEVRDHDDPLLRDNFGDEETGLVVSDVIEAVIKDRPVTHCLLDYLVEEVWSWKISVGEEICPRCDLYEEYERLCKERKGEPKNETFKTYLKRFRNSGYLESGSRLNRGPKLHEHEHPKGYDIR